MGTSAIFASGKYPSRYDNYPNKLNVRKYIMGRDLFNGNYTPKVLKQNKKQKLVLIGFQKEYTKLNKSPLKYPETLFQLPSPQFKNLIYFLEIRYRMKIDETIKTS